MSVKVKYVPAPADVTGNDVKEEWEQKIADLVYAVEKELEKNAGFLKLIDLKTETVFYYNQRICGIFGDLSKLSDLGFQADAESVARELLKYKEKDAFLRISHFPAEALHKEEYQTLFLEDRYQSLAEEKGWQNFKDINVMVVDPQYYYGSKERPGCLIPAVFRCEKNGWGIHSNSTLYELVFRLIREGMRPVAYTGIENERWQELSVYIEKRYGFPKAGTEVPEPGTVISLDDENKLEQIKEFYRKKDFFAANLPVYDDTIFQKTRGSWDLYPFADLDREKAKGKGGIWYEVDGLYAKNPVEDAASGVEQVAIDFGTKSTTVAILDNRGNITMIPVGALESAEFENPTILKFQNIRKFMEAYKSEKFRPDTKFEDISVSQAAMSDYEDSVERTDTQMYQYINHLKQWANNPGSTLEVIDSMGEEFSLACGDSRSSEEKLNPIEIYAYYIGRNINNMHHGKVYLRYLLSYTSTYTEKSREWIRSGFEKGLRKSLPPQIGNDTELMKKFQVRTWCDEATAYAVSAVSRYLEEDYRSERVDGICRKELEAGGIFYGIYDFGGGTLDFSFGLMRQKGEKDVYSRLKYGGSPNMGCENLLEALAFDIFSRPENRTLLKDKKIKCEKPFLYGIQQNEYQIVGNSNAARANTCSMIAYLRGIWMNGTEGVVIRLQDEKGNRIRAKFGEKAEQKRDRDGNVNIVLQMDMKTIEEYFCAKVTEGIRLFIEYYKEVLEFHRELADKKCIIFLAGNASRAKRVQNCFREELKKEGLSEHFCMKLCLPTKSDREEQEKHPTRSIPTAKSGVVFGMLLARPGTSDIEIIDDMPKVNFRYHIGRKKKDRAYAQKGLFQLLLHADQVSETEDVYQFLMAIPKQEFEILYTDDGGYALQTSMRPVGDEVNVMEIHVPEQYVGSGLFVRAKADSGEILELGVSSLPERYQQTVELFGICDFAKGNFKMLSEEGDKNREEGQETATPGSGCNIYISDKNGIRYQRRLLENEEIKLGEALFKTDSEYLEVVREEAPGISNIKEKWKIGEPGDSKKIYLCKAKEHGLKVGVICQTQGEEDQFFEIDMTGEKLKVKRL